MSKSAASRAAERNVARIVLVLVGVGVCASVAALVARHPVALAMGGGACLALMGGRYLARFTAVRGKGGEASQTALIPWTLLLFVCGVFLGGRSFSYLGLPPVFFGDVLAVALITTRLFKPSKDKHERAFRLAAYCYASLGIVVLFVHPIDLVAAQRFYIYWLVLFASAIASLTRDNLILLWKLMVFLSTIAAAISVATYLSNWDWTPAASSALYIAPYPIEVAVGGTRGRMTLPRVGLHILAALIFVKRGPILAIGAAILVALLAKPGSRGQRMLSTYAAAALAICAVTALVLAPVVAHLPVLGPNVARFAATFTETESTDDSPGVMAASENAKWRAAVQATAVRQTLERAPFIGLGLGTTITSLDPRLDPSNDSRRAVHNSYVGALLYGGTLTVLFLVALTGAALWRIARFRTPLALRYGALLVACIAISATNVGLEGPYIGSVYWLALGAVMSSACKPFPSRTRRLGNTNSTSVIAPHA